MEVPANFTADQLTKALRQCGVLQGGSVKAVKAESTRLTVLSRIVKLAVSYDGAPPEAPPSIIFKTSHPDRVSLGWTAGRHEVAFYTQVASAPSGRLILAALPRIAMRRRNPGTFSCRIWAERIGRSRIGRYPQRWAIAKGSSTLMPGIKPYRGTHRIRSIVNVPHDLRTPCGDHGA